MIRLSVIIPTYNPDVDRLRRVLEALRAQTLPCETWETIIVDNASTNFPASSVTSHASERIRVVAEPVLGLSHARRAGLAAARGDFAIFVDDDNILACDYLEQTLSCFEASPSLGAIGGKSLPEFTSQPPAWVEEFYPLLALRDLGGKSIIADSLQAAEGKHGEYPLCAPIGAGMALRRSAWAAWTGQTNINAFSDRCGDSLTSGGDNDIVLHVLKAGWSVGYFPQLSLTHLVPLKRVQPAYLARLNRGIQFSWMQVLARHEVNPWDPLTRTGALLRQIKAWFTYRVWDGSAPSYVRWQGACGHFLGRVPADTHS